MFLFRCMLEEFMDGLSRKKTQSMREHVEEDQVAILLDLLKSPNLDPQTRTMLEQALYVNVCLRPKAS